MWSHRRNDEREGSAKGKDETDNNSFNLCGSRNDERASDSDLPYPVGWRRRWGKSENNRSFNITVY